ncbi:MAG: phytanoyl-CoA dioxygenase family protein [Ottowia sp.]|uniref:phytanoyl-CoA dioxygenase family protein n=1 Tax=Ottowia sp. TaxID=1898956 RepID=UPI0039E70AAB
MASSLLLARETRALKRLLRHPLPHAGQRDLLAQPWCAALAARVRRRLAAQGVLADDALAVQCTLFDKSPARNWLVAWHQDLSVPMQGKTNAPGWRGWSVKQGGAFCQPPADFLQSLLAVRVHIDSCGAGHGPLRVLPASHRLGRLPADQRIIRTLRTRLGEVACTAAAGDALLMRPLLVHASSRMAPQGADAQAAAGRRRRVLHFVFAPPALPAGLRWAVAC